MRFVALDLETTGLDTNNDTIIEIAAVGFTLELVGETFTIANIEEHSQLISPGRVLEQEISMITGITNDMLIGKPAFDDVRDRVRNFIADAIIVGHNVLFDIAMLRSHGIDLEKNSVIDTFELSEIFSQDVESLNLGFLANRYNLINPEEEEHRALTDTKVSIRLFTHYLGEIRLLDTKKRAIWNTLSERDMSHTLTTISKICHTPLSSHLSVIDLISSMKRERVSGKVQHTYHEKSHQHPLLIDTQGDLKTEIKLIKDGFKTHSHIELITPGYKSAVWMEQILKQEGIGAMLKITDDKWCSLKYIEELLKSSESYDRKKLILILKIMFWITKTETGLLDELKYYGEERALIDMFRSSEDESSIWQESYYSNLEKVPLLISEIGSYRPGEKTHRLQIIKDITLIEDIVRRKNSKHISFDQILDQIDQLSGNGILQEYKIHMKDMVEIIRGIYESVPERPTGPLISPPGAYGETYFITQAMLWHRGHKWLVHASRTLESAWKSWKQDSGESSSGEITKNTNSLGKSIAILSEYHTYRDNNNNCILTIQKTETELTLIPRHIHEYIKPLLLNATAYGNNIGYPQTKEFLIREYGYRESDFDSLKGEKILHRHRIEYHEYHGDIVPSGAVILTTSQKHARDIGQELRKIYGKNREILIQGLSGGKGKMLSIFTKNTHKTILVGLIDTWRDEYNLWPHATEIIITKLPFDPPTDPYFLGRTVGMSNNFSQYSEPIVTIRLNTLIERIISSGYSKTIYTSDNRLLDTEWGRRIHSELL